MVPHRQILLLLLAVPLAVVSACDRVPLLAPTGTVITILPATNTVSLNSQIQIVATAIQNGVASSGSGTGATTTTSTGGQPVQNGTVISFTTTIGTIQPQEARTHDGQVTVTLVTAGQSGTATITAYSGGASSSVKLAVGTAAVSNIIVSSTPASLGSAGGTAQVTAQVTDEGGSGVGGVPVTFTTDQGSVSPSTATTDGNGNATVSLNTTSTATVTAAAGAKTATVKVAVQARAITGFAASPTSATAGTPITFTVTPATGANVSNVHIEFGDGQFTNTGPISTAQGYAHPYGAAGNYTATAMASDGTTLTAPVTIGSLQLTLTASSSSPPVSTPVTFTIGNIGTAQIDHVVWTYDDGDTHSGSSQDTHTFTSRGVHSVHVQVIGVGGGSLGTATTSVDVT